MAWKLLTRLLDSSKGRKPTLILRTQLSVRVNAILGKCMRALESRNPPPQPRWLSFFQACAGQWTRHMKTGCVAPPHSYPDLSFQGQG